MPNSIDLLVGQRVSQLRKQRSVSLTEISGRLLLSEEVYSAKEQGISRFSATELKTICEFLDITPREIYDAVLEPDADERSKILDELRLRLL